MRTTLPCNINTVLTKFQGVFACASLIHIEPEILPDVLRRIRNVLVDNGYLVMMVQDGEGVNESKSMLEVDGKKLRRTVYCYTREDLVSYLEEVNMEFIREGYLDESLIEYGWRNYIFGMSKKNF